MVILFSFLIYIVFIYAVILSFFDSLKYEGLINSAAVTIFTQISPLYTCLTLE